MELTIDFSNVKDWATFHTLMVSSFRLPSFCRMSGHAYIDCLTSLWYPEDCMTEISLAPEEVLELTIINEGGDKKLFEIFKDIIFLVNERYLEGGKIPPIVVKKIER